MSERTKDQEFADKLDCELYRLIVQAERQGEKEKHWRIVAAALRDTRALIRIRMHQKDREQTI